MPSVKLTNIIKVKSKDEMERIIEVICSCYNQEYVVDLNRIIPEPYCLTQLRHFEDDEIFALAANAISDMFDIEGRGLTKEEIKDAMKKFEPKNGNRRDVFIERIIEGSRNYGVIYNLCENNDNLYVFNISFLALMALSQEEVIHEYYWRKSKWGYTTEKPRVVICEEVMQIRWTTDGLITSTIIDKIKEKSGIDFIYLFL